MIQLMAGDANPDSSAGRLNAGNGDALDVIETEMAVLVRTLERLNRRSDLHRDLDRASYLIARTLETVGPVSINELAATLGLDATTVTRQVATMQAAGLILRRTDPNDARVSLIRLSQPGRRTMRNVRSARKERIATLLGHWTESDRRELGRLLTRFNDELSRDITHSTST